MRRVVFYLIVLEYLRRKMVLEVVGVLTGEQFKDSAEAGMPAPFPTVSYTYDPIGNITQKHSGTTTLGYAYHPQKKHAVNSITVNGTPYAFDYDQNGNMISGYDLTNPAVIVSRSMTYNADNMPLQITRGGASTTLSYDGEGKRVKKTGPSGTTEYVGDHYEIINNDPTKYIFAGNLRVAKVSSAEGTKYFHKDHLGSSSAMTTDAGGVQEETNYMPFGEQREHTGLELSNYKFTDQELDPETGLYNYGARLYDAVVGRFISPDAIVPYPMEPQSWNRFSYVRNNPLKLYDPTGRVDIIYSAGRFGQYNPTYVNLAEPGMNYYVADRFFNIYPMGTGTYQRTVVEGRSFDYVYTPAETANVINWGRTHILTNRLDGATGNAGLWEVGNQSLPGQLWDTKQYLPYTSTFIVNGKAEQRDYVGNVIWGTGLNTLGIGEKTARLGAQLQSIWANGTMDDSRDREAISFGYTLPLPSFSGYGASGSWDNSTNNGYPIYPIVPDTNMMEGVYFEW